MKKDNNNTAKVNKEIGGWDYKGFHIDRDKAMKCLTILVDGDEVTAKTLGEAKEIIDDVIEKREQKPVEQPAEQGVVTWVSKRGTEYLLQVVNGVVRAFTYEAGKKHYWTVTKEIREFASGMMM